MINDEFFITCPKCKQENPHVFTYDQCDNENYQRFDCPECDSHMDLFINALGQVYNVEIVNMEGLDRIRAAKKSLQSPWVSVTDTHSCGHEAHIPDYISIDIDRFKFSDICRWNFDADDLSILVCTNEHESDYECVERPIHPADALKIINLMRVKLLAYESNINAMKGLVED